MRVLGQNYADLWFIMIWYIQWWVMTIFFIDDKSCVILYGCQTREMPSAYSRISNLGTGLFKKKLWVIFCFIKMSGEKMSFFFFFDKWWKNELNMLHYCASVLIMYLFPFIIYIIILIYIYFIYTGKNKKLKALSRPTRVYSASPPAMNT